MSQLLKSLSTAFSRGLVPAALFLMTISGCAMLNSDSSLIEPRSEQSEVQERRLSVDDRPISRRPSPAPEDGRSAAGVENSRPMARTTPAFGHSVSDSQSAARLLTPKFGDGRTNADSVITGGHSFTRSGAAASPGLTPGDTVGRISDRIAENGNTSGGEAGGVVPVSGTSDPRLQIPPLSAGHAGTASAMGRAPAIEPSQNAIGPASPDPPQPGWTPPANAVARADRPRVPPPTAGTPPPATGPLPAGSQQPGPPAPNANAIPVPSMFDRFKGLTERSEPAAERRATELIREQFRRLQNPFDIWRDDEPPQTAQVPGQTSPAAVIPAMPPSQDPLLQLIAGRQQQLSNWPRSSEGAPLQPELFRRRQLDLRLLQLIADDPAAAMAAIDRVSSEEQEFWQELILAISRFRSPDEELEREEQMAQTVAQLRSAVQHLELLSPLSIRRADFCSQVHGFGSIETYLTNGFKPGDPVIIYVELDNLESDLSHDGTWKAVVSGNLQIVGDSSNEIEAYPLPTVEDQSTSLRTDYYHTYQITLPSHLHRGSYEVRLHLKDELSNRRVSSTLPFRIE